MRNIFVGSVVVLSTLLILSSASAQTTRQSETDSHAKPQPFDPHDLSGVWLLRTPYAGISNQAPPLTAWGQAKFDANKPSYGPKAVPPALGNDVIGNCDPTGFPAEYVFTVPTGSIHSVAEPDGATLSVSFGTPNDLDGREGTS